MKLFWMAFMVVVCIVLMAFVVLFNTPAMAHEWYSGTNDPVSGYGCCGGSDCHTIPAKWLIQEGDGYRVRLTLEQTRYVNPGSSSPIDAFIPRSRIQDSQESNYAICLYSSTRTAPSYGVICFFEPPGS